MKPQVSRWEFLSSQSLIYSRVFHHVVDQGHDRRTLGRGVLVVSAARPVDSHNKLEEIRNF